MSRPHDENEQGEDTDDPIAKRIKELQQMQRNQVPSMEMLQKLAAQMLGQLDGIMAVVGEDDIADMAKGLHGTLSNLTEQDLMMANFIILQMQMNQGAVETYLKEAYKVGADRQSVVKSMESAKKIFADIDEEDYVAMLEQMIDVYPSRMKAMIEASMGGSIEDYGRKRYADLTTKSAEDLATEQIEKSRNIPVEKLTELFMNAAGNATPDNLAKAAKHFTDNVQPSAFEKIARGGLKFTREVLSATAQGNPFKLDKAKLDPDFAPTLKHVFQAVEDALDEANMLPDANEVARLLRAANDNDQAPETPSIKPPAL